MRCFLGSKISIFLLGFWVSTSGFAGADFRPGWAADNATSFVPNSSFLNDRKNRTDKAQLPDIVFEPSQIQSMCFNYENMFRDYEEHKKYGLIDQQAERNHIEQVQSFGENIKTTIKDYHVRKNLRTAREATMKDESLKVVAKNLAVVGVVAGLYTGNSLDVPISDSTKLSARTHLPGEQLNKLPTFSPQLRVFSPVINGDFEFTRTVPERRDASNGTPGERYRLSVSRGFPVWSLSSALSYGSTSSSLNASLSKQLNEHLTCVFDTKRPLAPDVSDFKISEETVKLIYGINF